MAYPSPACVMRALSTLPEVERRVVFETCTTIEQWARDGESELTTVVTAKEPVNMLLIEGAFRELGYLVSLDEEYERQITIKWRY